MRLRSTIRRLTLATVSCALALSGFSSLRAQSTPSAAPASQREIPAWQTKAGGQMTFDSASIKLGTSGSPESGNVPMGTGDVYAPTHGVFYAKNVLLIEYLLFAYKLQVTSNQMQAMRTQLPAWANTNRYDIEGRATGNPTKDQFRLMMQSLLAERFKLAVHFDKRQQSVYALVLDTPGKLGPRLRPHEENPPCTYTRSPDEDDFAGVFPTTCGGIIGAPESEREHFGGRNVTMEQIAGSLSGTQSTDVGRPVLDQTNLTGTFDFSLDFTPGLNDTPQSALPDDSELPFPQALKEQLGLKLEPLKAPVEFLYIDHVERPTEN